MTVLSELISAWNQFATENESFEEVVRQIYGDNLTPAKAVELVKQCTKWLIYSRLPLVVDSVRWKPWWMFYHPHLTD